MSKICDCCGKEMNSGTYTKLENYYNVCWECYDKISKLQKGDMSYAEVMTPKTTSELKDYLRVGERQGVEQKQKQAEREANPLYQDIHQLANDVHFIKNFIIFCLILTVVGCIIYSCQMTNMIH